MQQNKLKKGGLITLITLLSMIPPLSTDLYLPAMPEMVEHFNTTTAMTSFTMTIFFIFMGIGILILGPLSDKFGRKPVLIWSIIVSFLFSIACAFAPTITLLIVARAIQAFSAGGLVAIATTLIKDSFDGKEMGKILSITQALTMLAPMAAPILGAIILLTYDWNMTFIALAVLNIITLIMALFLEETLPENQRLQGNPLQSLVGLTKVIKNPAFTNLLLIGGLLTAPFMAYLSVASYIYINQFQTSETTFSLYFAVTSAVAMLGPIIYMKFGRQSFQKVIVIAFIVTTLSGVLLLLLGKISPVIFLISYLPFAVMTTYIRPYIADVLLSQ